MSIEFRCGNIVAFDPQQNKYMTCDEVICVEDSMAGDSMLCPGCENLVDIPFKAPPAASYIEAGEFASQPVEVEQLESGVVDAEQAESEVVKSASARTTRPARQRSTVRPQSTSKGRKDNFALGPPDEQSNETAPEFGTHVPQSTEIIEPARFTRGNTCAKCGSRINPSQKACGTCGRLLPADISQVQQPLEIRHKRTGFQLWVSGMFSPADTQTPNTALPIIHAVVGMLVVVTVVVFVFFGGILGLLLAFPLVVVTAAYVSTLWKWREFETKPEAVPYFWQRIIWNLLLRGNRLIGWQNPFDSSKKRFVLDLRGTTTGDHDLHEPDGIAHAAVVDLEGLPITDQGLLYLYKRKSMRFLVLRKTNVTVEGIFRLQQALPRTWIWT